MGKTNVQYKNCSYLQRDYSKFDEDTFIADFSQPSCDNLSSTNLGVNKKFAMFYQNVLTCVDKHVPLKKVHRKSLSFRSKPWISNRIKKMISQRDKYLRKFKRTYNKDTENLYKKFRNKVVNGNRQAKKGYYDQYFVKHKDNMKMLWAGMNILS